MVSTVETLTHNQQSYGETIEEPLQMISIVHRTKQVPSSECGKSMEIFDKKHVERK